MRCQARQFLLLAFSLLVPGSPDDALGESKVLVGQIEVGNLAFLLLLCLPLLVGDTARGYVRSES